MKTPGSENISTHQANAAPLALNSNEIRNVAPHSCGTERRQEINLPIVGGKFPAAHGSCREFYRSDARELSDRCSCNFHLTTIGKTSSSIKESLSISMFRCRLWTRCLFTFTKLATSQSRCGVSSLDKASTTSRSELIPKRVKPCTASSLAVTVSSSAADRPGLQLAPAARIRTDLRCRTLISTPCSTLFAGSDNYQWIADKR